MKFLLYDKVKYFYQHFPLVAMRRAEILWHAWGWYGNAGGWGAGIAIERSLEKLLSSQSKYAKTLQF